MIYRLIMLIFIPSLAFSNCVEKAHEYGNGQNLVDLSSECFDLVKGNAILKSALNNEVKMYGYENMIFMEFSDITKYQVRPAKKLIAIAGSELGFDKFEDGVILEQKKQILVLSDGKLSVFRMNVGGNVAPLYALKSEKLKDAESFSIDDKDIVTVSYKGNNLKRTFQLEKKKISFLAEIE